VFELLSPTAVRIDGITFTATPGVKIISTRTLHRVARGVHLRFPNGFVLSVQWGSENYCRSHGDRLHRSCIDAEIAVWHGKGPIIGDVVPGVKAPEVLGLIPHLMGLSARDRNIDLRSVLDERNAALV
jgi:hypothetical protein